MKVDKKLIFLILLFICLSNAYFINSQEYKFIKDINKITIIDHENRITTNKDYDNDDLKPSKSEEKKQIEKNNKKFWPSFISGFSLIFISEIGDKTFILALYFSFKIGVIKTFLTASTTLVILNAIWILVGASLPILIYQVYINWFALFLFLLFSILMLIDGMKMEEKVLLEELKELDQEDKEKERKRSESINKNLAVDQELQEKLLVKNSTEENKYQTTDITDKQADQEILKKEHDKNEEESDFTVISGLAITLVLSEMGDKSQITAIAIASIYDLRGVLYGSSLAHASAAFIAVSIGYYFSSKISEKSITLMGSALFFMYAIIFFLNIQFDIDLL